LAAGKKQGGLCRRTLFGCGSVAIFLYGCRIGRKGAKKSKKEVIRGGGEDIMPGTGSGSVEWEIYWSDQDGWLGYNMEVKIDVD